MQIEPKLLNPVREEPGQSLAALLFYRDNLNTPFNQNIVPRYTVRSSTASVIGKRGHAIKADLSSVRVISPDGDPKRLGARLPGRCEVFVPCMEYATSTHLKVGESVRDVLGRCVATVIQQRDADAVRLLELHSIPTWSRGEKKAETENLILELNNTVLTDDFRVIVHENFPVDAKALAVPNPDSVAVTGEEILVVWSQWAESDQNESGAENKLPPNLIVCHPDTWAKVQEAAKNYPYALNLLHRGVIRRDGTDAAVETILAPTTDLSPSWRHRGLTARIGPLGVVVHPNVPTCRCYLISDPRHIDSREGVHTFRSAMVERAEFTALPATEKGRDLVVVYEEMGLMLSGAVSCRAMWVVDSLEALPAVRSAHFAARGSSKKDGFFAEDDGAFADSFLDLEN